MARPRMKPSSEQRRLVKSLAAYGLRQEDIANLVGLRSVKTLRRHFRQELDRGAIEAQAKVAEALFKMATSGKDVRATRFWLQALAGWRDGHELDQRPPNPPPFIVRRAEESE